MVFRVKSKEKFMFLVLPFVVSRKGLLKNTPSSTISKDNFHGRRRSRLVCIHSVAFTRYSSPDLVAVVT